MQRYKSDTIPLETQRLLLHIILEAEPSSEISLMEGIIEVSREHPELKSLLQIGSAIQKPESLEGEVKTTILESMLSLLRIQGAITKDKERVAFTYLTRLRFGDVNPEYQQVASKVANYMS